MIEKFTCYTAKCDVCGEHNDGGDYVPHFTDPKQAIDDAIESEWQVVADKYIVCLECQPISEIQLLAIKLEEKQYERKV